MIDIYLRFKTFPGQTLFISGDLIRHSGQSQNGLLQMQYADENHWKIQLELPGNLNSFPDFLGYYFVFVDENGKRSDDAEKARRLWKNHFKKDITILDTWNDMGAIENVFLSSPFQRTFQLKYPNAKSSRTFGKKIRFRVMTALLDPGYVLCITGSRPVLGNWLAHGPLPMRYDGMAWNIDFDYTGSMHGLAYKYVLCTAEGRFVRYEDGENRSIGDVLPEKGKIIVQDGFARFNPPRWRGTGVAIPVFSLRTARSLGAGDFNDIPALVDWAQGVSIKMIQLLPVNDTTASHTYLDSYPYAAISVFALHPLYASIEKIAGKKYAKFIAADLEKGRKLNQLDSVSFEKVMDLKWKLLRKLYLLSHDEVFSKKTYQQFFNNNRDWLVPYAVFSYLRDKKGTVDHSTWEKFSKYDSSKVTALLKAGSKSHVQIAFYFFVQYHLHLQLKHAHAYAQSKGLILKGDIAIGVHRYGADVWKDPDLFLLDLQAGAPPDDFSEKGQNWGFPTYHWEKMQQENYRWWQRRLSHMSNYFDAFRIDHILGFFRIWSIPSHAVEGIMGRFIPAIPVKRLELEQKGIRFKPERYCKPWITDAVIWEIAGDLSQDIKFFLDMDDKGNYQFKPGFETQKLIEQFFSHHSSNEKNKRLRQILYDLHSNVIFWEDEKEQGYHFRFHVHKTLSFKYLDDRSREVLTELYDNYYFHSQDLLWKDEAMNKLPSIKRFTDMLICGEDLGLIPRSVPEVMRSLGILGLEVQRMPKRPGLLFLNLTDAPYLSVVTPSTHDMSTIRGWWEENKKNNSIFYHEQLGFIGDAPEHCNEHIARSIVLQHLSSPAMWAVFQIQDFLSLKSEFCQQHPEQERINLPEDPKHYWKYRMPMTIETLQENKIFNAELQEMIHNNGR